MQIKKIGIKVVMVLGFREDEDEAGYRDETFSFEDGIFYPDWDCYTYMDGGATNRNPLSDREYVVGHAPVGASLDELLAIAEAA
jgi:hypothetical protein